MPSLQPVEREIAPAPRQRVRRTQEQRSQATRRALMEAARQVIGECGYAGTTMEEIARRAGVSRGAQTHHYPSKQVLVLAVADHIFANVEREVSDIANRLQYSGGNIEAFFNELWETAFSSLNFNIILELVTASRTDPILRDKLQRRWHDLMAAYDNIWRRALKRSDGFSEEVRQALELTLSLMRGMAYERVVRDNEPAYYTEQLGHWAKVVRGIMTGDAATAESD